MERGRTTGSTSLLCKKVNITGEIQGNEDLHVEGRFKGSIKITGNIFIGPTGVVDADVEAENIIIQGKINGNVLARQRLEIQSLGQLIGDCSAQINHFGVSPQGNVGIQAPGSTSSPLPAHGVSSPEDRRLRPGG